MCATQGLGPAQFVLHGCNLLLPRITRRFGQVQRRAHELRRAVLGGLGLGVLDGGILDHVHLGVVQGGFVG